MSIYPLATWRPLPEANEARKIQPTQVILHSAVSGARTLFPFFARGDVGVESHFYVDESGRVEQYVATDRQADANYRSNSRAISIETWDDRRPDALPWNPAQLEALTDLLLWSHYTHRIPLRPAPRYDAPGVGGHTDFPGLWTPYRGKTCPGLARRPQVRPLIARARQLAAGPNRILAQQVVQRGSVGPVVAIVQQHLRLTPDGRFGPMTHAAVIRYQRDRNLIIDGVVGPEFWQEVFGPKPAPTLNEDDLMPTAQEIAEAILHHPLPREGSRLGGTTSLAAVISNWDRAQELGRDDVQAVKAAVHDLTKVVGGESRSPDPAADQAIDLAAAEPPKV